jgi:hypothetical protein
MAYRVMDDKEIALTLPNKEAIAFHRNEVYWDALAQPVRSTYRISEDGMGVRSV